MEMDSQSSPEMDALQCTPSSFRVLFECDFCEGMFHSVRALRAHRYKVHGINSNAEVMVDVEHVDCQMDTIHAGEFAEDEEEEQANKSTRPVANLSTSVEPAAKPVSSPSKNTAKKRSHKHSVNPPLTNVDTSQISSHKFRKSKQQKVGLAKRRLNFQTERKKLSLNAGSMFSDVSQCTASDKGVQPEAGEELKLDTFGSLDDEIEHLTQDVQGLQPSLEGQSVKSHVISPGSVQDVQPSCDVSTDPSGSGLAGHLPNVQLSPELGITRKTRTKERLKKNLKNSPNKHYKTSAAANDNDFFPPPPMTQVSSGPSDTRRDPVSHASDTCKDPGQGGSQQSTEQRSPLPSPQCWTPDSPRIPRVRLKRQENSGMYEVQLFDVAPQEGEPLPAPKQGEPQSASQQGQSKCEPHSLSTFASVQLDTEQSERSTSPITVLSQPAGHDSTGSNVWPSGSSAYNFGMDAIVQTPQIDNTDDGLDDGGIASELANDIVVDKTVPHCDIAITEGVDQSVCGDGAFQSEHEVTHPDIGGDRAVDVKNNQLAQEFSMKLPNQSACSEMMEIRTQDTFQENTGPKDLSVDTSDIESPHSSLITRCVKGKMSATPKDVQVSKSMQAKDMKCEQIQTGSACRLVKAVSVRLVDIKSILSQCSLSTESTQLNKSAQTRTLRRSKCKSGDWKVSTVGSGNQCPQVKQLDSRKRRKPQKTFQNKRPNVRQPVPDGVLQISKTEDQILPAAHETSEDQNESGTRNANKELPSRPLNVSPASKWKRTRGQPDKLGSQNSPGINPPKRFPESRKQAKLRNITKQKNKLMMQDTHPETDVGVPSERSQLSMSNQCLVDDMDQSDATQSKPTDFMSTGPGDILMGINDPSAKKSLRCQFCGKVYKHRWHFTVHESKHTAKNKATPNLALVQRPIPKLDAAANQMAVGQESSLPPILKIRLSRQKKKNPRGSRKTVLAGNPATVDVCGSKLGPTRLDVFDFTDDSNDGKGPKDENAKRVGKGKPKRTKNIPFQRSRKIKGKQTKYKPSPIKVAVPETNIITFKAIPSAKVPGAQAKANDGAIVHQNAPASGANKLFNRSLNWKRKQKLKTHPSKESGSKNCEFVKLSDQGSSNNDGVVVTDLDPISMPLEKTDKYTEENSEEPCLKAPVPDVIEPKSDDLIPPDNATHDIITEEVKPISNTPESGFSTGSDISSDMSSEQPSLSEIDIPDELPKPEVNQCPSPISSSHGNTDKDDPPVDLDTCNDQGIKNLAARGFNIHHGRHGNSHDDADDDIGYHSSGSCEQVSHDAQEKVAQRRRSPRQVKCTHSDPQPPQMELERNLAAIPTMLPSPKMAGLFKMPLKPKAVPVGLPKKDRTQSKSTLFGISTDPGEDASDSPCPRIDVGHVVIKTEDDPVATVPPETSPEDAFPELEIRTGVTPGSDRSFLDSFLSMAPATGLKGPLESRQTRSQSALHTVKIEQEQPPKKLNDFAAKLDVFKLKLQKGSGSSPSSDGVAAEQVPTPGISKQNAKSPRTRPYKSAKIKSVARGSVKHTLASDPIKTAESTLPCTNSDCSEQAVLNTSPNTENVRSLWDSVLPDIFCSPPAAQDPPVLTRSPPPVVHLAHVPSSAPLLTAEPPLTPLAPAALKSSTEPVIETSEETVAQHLESYKSSSVEPSVSSSLKATVQPVNSAQEASPVIERSSEVATTPFNDLSAGDNVELKVSHSSTQSLCSCGKSKCQRCYMQRCTVNIERSPKNKITSAPRDVMHGRHSKPFSPQPTRGSPRRRKATGLGGEVETAAGGVLEEDSKQAEPQVSTKQ